MKFGSDGFSLPEVLIASAIVAVSATGIIALQAKYIRADDAISMHRYALNIAKQKLSDLEQYNALLNDGTNTGAYQDILDNQGGTIQPGSVLYETDEAGNTVEFYQTWAVVDQFFEDTDEDGENDTWLTRSEVIDLGLPVKEIASLKQVTITVSWDSENGQQNTLLISGNIPPLVSDTMSRGVKRVNTSEDFAPVQFDISNQPSEAVHLIDNNSVFTTAPLITIENEHVQTRLSTHEITHVNSQDNWVAQQDFVTINCKCKLAGSGYGLTPAMTELDSNNQLSIALPEEILKETGIPYDSSEPQLCDSCCMNHHDTVDMVNNNQYYRETNGLPHSHFERRSSSQFIPAMTIGDPYHESCRFRRIDGHYELYPDWHLSALIVMSQNYLEDGNETDYQEYVKDILAGEITGTPITRPLAGRDVTLDDAERQLVARGIYIDKMSPSHLKIVQDELSSGNTDWQSLVPFYDINLTLLSEWVADDTQIAEVTMESITSVSHDDYYGYYSRGRVTPLMPGITSVSAAVGLNNEGLLGIEAVAADTADAQMTDSIEITVE